MNVVIMNTTMTKLMKIAIINESNKIESSDISEHSDTNGDENFKNGEIRCNNVDRDDDGD